jgi:Family of unknown function (DUF6364)
LYVNQFFESESPMSQPSKLTLRLDSGLIDSAKEFAQVNQRSLSQLVADYFARLGAQSGTTVSSKAKTSSPNAASLGESRGVKVSAELSPVTMSLRGALKTKARSKATTKKQTKVEPDKATYGKHLEEKYL